MPRRIRVLHAVLDLNAGGLERLVADMVRTGQSTDFEFHVLALRYLGRFAEGLAPYASLHTAPPMGRLSLLHPSALIRLVRQIAPDVVHSHSGVWYKMSRAAQAAGAPFVVHTDHGRRRPDPWRDRLFDWAASRHTDVVVAVSDVLGEQLRRTVVAHPERVQVVLNGVDTEDFAPGADSGALRCELGIDADRPIIGSVGRLEPIKGYDIVVEAFGLLARRWTGPGAPVLVIAGDGSEAVSLAARLRELGVSDRSFLLGWRKDLLSLYRSFALFTMGSRSEGTSVSLLEAMSTGLCPVVTDVGGNAVVIGPRLGHRLVPALDPAALAAGWEGALRDEARRRADAMTARARVVADFSLAAMVKAYERIYRQGGTVGG